jgi:hypothetical protein
MLTPTRSLNAALPPEGAESPWGGPAVNGLLTPTHDLTAVLPPEGAESPWDGPAAIRFAERNEHGIG